MLTDHDTVIADFQAEARAFCEACDYPDGRAAVRAKLAENEGRYPVEEARGSNRKAP